MLSCTIIYEWLPPKHPHNNPNWTFHGYRQVKCCSRAFSIRFWKKTDESILREEPSKIEVGLKILRGVLCLGSTCSYYCGSTISLLVLTLRSLFTSYLTIADMSSQERIVSCLNNHKYMFTTPAHSNSQLLPTLFFDLVEEYEGNPDKRIAKIVEVGQFFLCLDWPCQ